MTGAPAGADASPHRQRLQAYLARGEGHGDVDRAGERASIGSYDNPVDGSHVGTWRPSADEQSLRADAEAAEAMRRPSWQASPPGPGERRTTLDIALEHVEHANHPSTPEPPPPPYAAAAGSVGARVRSPTPSEDMRSWAERGAAAERPARAPAHGPCADLAWAARSFPCSLLVLLVALVLIGVGKTVQEANRPAESGAMWELASCCAHRECANATGAGVNGTASGSGAAAAAADGGAVDAGGGGGAECFCHEWAGRFDGPGTLCPAADATGAAQTVVIHAADAQLRPGRPYALVLYVSTGAGVTLDWSLTDAEGGTLVPRTISAISALDAGAAVTRRRQRRQLLPAAAAHRADAPVGAAARASSQPQPQQPQQQPQRQPQQQPPQQQQQQRAPPTARLLLKGGFSGGSSSGGRFSGSHGSSTHTSRGGSAGGHAGASGHAYWHDPSSAHYVRGSGAYAAGRGVRDGPSGSFLAPASHFQRSAVGYPYGYRAPAFAATWLLLSHTHRRDYRSHGTTRTSASGDTGEAAQTDVALDRVLLEPPTFSVDSRTPFPLTLVVSSLAVSTYAPMAGEPPASRRLASAPPFVLAALGVPADAAMLGRFRLGVCLWALGCAFVAALTVTNLCRFRCAFIGSPTHLHRRVHFRASYMACVVCGAAATLGVLAAGIGAAAVYTRQHQTTGSAVGWLLVVVAVCVLLLPLCHDGCPWYDRDATTGLPALAHLAYVGTLGARSPGGQGWFPGCSRARHVGHSLLCVGVSGACALGVLVDASGGAWWIALGCALGAAVLGAAVVWGCDVRAEHLKVKDDKDASQMM